MYKLEFKLQQHTPIIHFQHDQNGATLRATEVKPKLDRFIIESNGGVNIVREKYLDWFATEQHDSLCYKISFNVNDVVWSYRKGWGTFFAEMGEENINKYKAGLSLQPVDLTISSLNVNLINFIKQNICRFFSSHCFGTRQSKGYGFYYPTRESPAFKEQNLYKDPLGSFYFEVNVSGSRDKTEKAYEVFHNIDLFYRVLRSGINEKLGTRFDFQDINNDGHEELINTRGTKFYCKPILFAFLKEKGLQWDKRTIKQAFFDTNYIKRLPDKSEKKWIEKEGVDPVNEVYEKGLKLQISFFNNSDVLSYKQNDQSKLALWRDLFGLSTKEQWKSYNNIIEKKHSTLKNGRWTEIPDNDPAKIVRYQSPLRFFPFLSSDGSKYTVFMTVEPQPEELQSAMFLVQCKNGSIGLPIGNAYTVRDILDWIVSKPFNLSQHVERKFHLEDTYNILKNIFRSFKKSN